MATYIALKDFERMGWLERASFADGVADGIEANAGTFPNPTESPSNLRIAAADVRTKFNAAQTGGDLEQEELEAAGQILSNKLHLDAEYVTLMSNSDRVKIVSSGFHCSGDKASRKTETYSVKVGDVSGQATFFYRKGLGEVSIVWRFCKKATEPVEDDWRIMAGTTENKIVKGGFESGVKHWFAVAPIKRGGDGTLHFLPPIYKYIP